MSISPGTSVEVEIADRRRKVAELYLRGEYQTTIAKEIGVAQATISRDLKALQKEWLQSSLVDFNHMRAQELAKIDTLEREYWDAWTRSKLNAEIKTTRAKGKRANDKEKPVPQEVEQIERSAGQTGNPSFLKGVEWCIDKRCQLFGLDAPLRVEWKAEAEAKGIDPGVIFNELVTKYVAALATSE